MEGGRHGENCWCERVFFCIGEIRVRCNRDITMRMRERGVDILKRNIARSVCKLCCSSVIDSFLWGSLIVSFNFKKQILRLSIFLSSVEWNLTSLERKFIRSFFFNRLLPEYILSLIPPLLSSDNFNRSSHRSKKKRRKEKNFLIQKIPTEP